MANGKITISRGCISGGRAGITINVEDLANRRLVDVEVDLAGFMEAITGLGYVPCDLITRAVYPEKVDIEKQDLLNALRSAHDTFDVIHEDHARPRHQRSNASKKCVDAKKAIADAIAKAVSKA